MAADSSLSPDARPVDCTVHKKLKSLPLKYKKFLSHSHVTLKHIIISKYSRVNKKTDNVDTVGDCLEFVCESGHALTAASAQV